MVPVRAAPRASDHAGAPTNHKEKSNMIKPTVGRVVLVMFAAGMAASLPGYAIPSEGTPVPGLIAFVHSDTCINVAAFDCNGTTMPLTSVRLIQPDEERPATGYWAEWMPYQVDQAKKVKEIEKNAAAIGCTKPDDRYLRAQAIEMALRTPGLSGHGEVLTAAAAFMAHIDDEATNGNRLVSEREKAMEELLRSACAIADRKGESTAWERFANSVRELGLNGVTARTYRVLPSDVE
jgi:hypothetical protein